MFYQEIIKESAVDALSYMGGGCWISAGLIILIMVISDLRGMFLNIPEYRVDFAKDPMLKWAYWCLAVGAVLLTIAHFIQ